METFFPEITNPLQEQARARKDMAMDNHIMAYVSLVEALEAQALSAQESGSPEGAKLYASAASAVRAQLSAMSAPPEQQGNEIGTTGANIGQPQNVPLEAQQSVEGGV